MGRSPLGETSGGVHREAMVLPMLESGDLPSDFRDDADHTQEILEAEKKITVDQESVQSLLEDLLAWHHPRSQEDDVTTRWRSVFWPANSGKGKIHKVHKDLVESPRCGAAAKSMQPILAVEVLSGNGLPLQEMLWPCGRGQLPAHVHLQGSGIRRGHKEVLKKVCAAV